MNLASIDPSHLLSRLIDILDSDPYIDEVGFVHPSQFDALNKEILKSEPVQASSSDQFFWHSGHKLGISTTVLVPLYRAAKDAFMNTLKRYRLSNSSHGQENELLDDNAICSKSFQDIIEGELLKSSRALLVLSCDFGTAWNVRRLITSKKQLLSLLMDELLLSTLVLSYAPKSERAWSHRRWVIKMIAGNCPNLQEIVERESELVKTLAENSKMNYRAWNHRCWLVSYMSDSQVIRELRDSRDWTGLHVADNSCFHYRARLLLQMVDDQWQNHAGDSLSSAKFHQMCKEELDWVEMLIRRYIGREALWLHRRFLSLLWMKHLSIDDQSISRHCCCRNPETCDITSFIANELEIFRACTIIPDSEFGDHQAQATYGAAYIMWLAKQMPSTFGVEVQNGVLYVSLERLFSEAGKGTLWDSLTASSGSQNHPA